jgi:hypothetical protein
MADETGETASNNSSTPVETCLHQDAKTNKRCANARLAGRVYCTDHKSEGAGGGGSDTCYISDKEEWPGDDGNKIR